MNSAGKQAQSDWNRFQSPRRPVAAGKRPARITSGGLYFHFCPAVWFLATSLLLRAQTPVTELNFAEFNSQSALNNFSGDKGTFASTGAGITMGFDTHVFHGTNGA